MKTAKQWIREYKSDRHLFERKLMFSNGDLIRAIQLDALKEAAEIADRIALQDCEAGDACEIRDAILTRIRELESSPENK